MKVIFSYKFILSERFNNSIIKYKLFYNHILIKLNVKIVIIL